MLKEKDWSNFYNRLVHFKHTDETDSAFGNRIGVGKERVLSWRGIIKPKPDVATIKKIIDALSLNVEDGYWLTFGEGPPTFVAVDSSGWASESAPLFGPHCRVR